MPRTTVTAQSPGALLAGAPGVGTLTLTMTAIDNANGNQFAMTGAEVILVSNPTGGALTVTVTSVANKNGRVGDISAYSIAAAGLAFIGPLALSQWKQADGNCYYTGSSASLLHAVVKLRGQMQYA